VSELELKARGRFEQLVLPHVDAAFNLARWLLRGRTDAEDVAQESLLRACRFIRGFHGGDARAWLLQIVRNTCYTWLEKNRPMELGTEFDEEIHLQVSATPETIAISGDDRERLIHALETLPPRFREVLCSSRARRLLLQGDRRERLCTGELFRTKRGLGVSRAAKESNDASNNDCRKHPIKKSARRQPRGG
jgi:RNA polymerase sigma-70 factor, ECF subfamily